MLIEYGDLGVRDDLSVVYNSGENQEKWVPKAPAAVQYMMGAMRVLSKLWNNHWCGLEVASGVLFETRDRAKESESVAAEEDYSRIAMVYASTHEVNLEVHIIIR